MRQIFILKLSMRYTVSAGDTLSSIAKKFGTTVADLKKINGLLTDAVGLGKILTIPQSANTPVFVPPKPVVPPPKTSPPSVKPPPKPPVAAPVKVVRYTVVAGDSLSSIAKKFGMTVEGLMQINGLKTTSLALGQLLTVVPTASAPKPTTVPVTPPVSKPPVVVVPPKPVTPPVVVPPLSEIDKIAIAREKYKVSKTPKDGYNQYVFTCENPSGGLITASFRDNVKSIYKAFDNGISYIGQAMPQLPLSMYQSVGLTEAQAKALRYVSMHEGKYDAINSYDKAIFSFGFIQFTGTGGSLGVLLAFYKHNCPDLFNKYFKSVGIDVSFNLKNNVIDFKVPTTVSVVNELTGEKETGANAWTYIKDHLPLIGPFIQSAYEPTMVREQLRVAAMMYVSVALNLQVTVPVFGTPVAVPALSQVLSSEGAMTMLIDLCVNRGAKGLSTVIVPAITAVAESVNVSSFAELCGISDLDVANMLITQNLQEQRIVKRTQSIIDAGLSFGKA